MANFVVVKSSTNATLRLCLYLKMLKIKIILNTLRLGKEIARVLRFRDYA